MASGRDARRGEAGEQAGREQHWNARRIMLCRTVHTPQRQRTAEGLRGGLPAVKRRACIGSQPSRHTIAGFCRSS